MTTPAPTDLPEALRLANELCEPMEGFAAPTALERSAADKLRKQHAALQEWFQKTEWVQKTLKPSELGMHYADILRCRLAALNAAAPAVVPITYVGVPPIMGLAANGPGTSAARVCPKCDIAGCHHLRAAPKAPQEGAPAHPIAPDVAADLERSDWTPEEALRWYAAGKHYDTVPNGDGTSSARILDNGEVAENALRAYDQPAPSGEVAGHLLAEHILGMDFVTARGLRARELARMVLAEDLIAALKAVRPAQPQAGAESYPPDWEALRHSANEWADMATNGLQWLRNIVSGASDAATALQNMESNLAHCRAVNDAPNVQHAVASAVALRAQEHDQALTVAYMGGFDAGKAEALRARGAVPSDCQSCSGSGEDPEGFYDQSRGPDGDMHDGPCRTCGGTGAAAVDQGEAMNAERIARALHAAVSAIYFDDSSKFKSALVSVVHAIDPTLAGEMLCNPKSAFDKSAARAAAKGQEGR